MYFTYMLFSIQGQIVCRTTRLVPGVVANTIFPVCLIDNLVFSEVCCQHYMYDLSTLLIVNVSRTSYDLVFLHRDSNWRHISVCEIFSNIIFSNIIFCVSSWCVNLIRVFLHDDTYTLS